MPPRVNPPRIPPACRALLLAIVLPAAVVPPPAAARMESGKPRPASSDASHPGTGGPAVPLASRGDSPLHRPPALPDTLLAIVGPGGSGPPERVIGLSRFVRAWSQVSPPARPDSLTPAGARGFLELLIGKEALGLAAARERWTWAPQESTGYATLEDRLVVAAMLDSALAAARTALGPAGDTLDRQLLGMAARDSAVARLRPAWDDSLAARLARAFAALPRPSPDSSLMAQLRMLGAMPAVDPADTGRAVARWAGGEYRVSELLAAWHRLNPLARPRIESATQVRDLVRNGLFERRLREAGRARGLERRADIAAALANQREYYDVSHLVAREVYARIPTDSLTLLRFWRETEKDWALPLRVRLTRVELPGRAEAGAMALRLRDAAQAESLEAGARRAGLDYAVELGAADDSALFARALRAGTGTVLGPDSLPRGGWSVARVVAVLPGRGRSFDEVRERVADRWYGEEGERLMRALMERERRRCRVRVNEAALAALVRRPPAEIARPRR